MQTTWTYNQGVFVGGINNLYTITGNHSYSDIAIRVANASIHKLIYSNGILKEPCEPNCDTDQVQFKGIFMRYMMYFFQSRNNTSSSSFLMFKQFANLNSNSVFKNDLLTQNGLDYFGLLWVGPSNVSQSLISQTSALDLFNSDWFFNQTKIFN